MYYTNCSNQDPKQVITFGGGRWPLLSKKPHPILLRPKLAKNSVWRFEDYGYNSILMPFVIGCFAIGTVVIVHKLPDSAWGTPSTPYQGMWLLIATGSLLLLYGLWCGGTSLVTEINTNENTIQFKTMFCSFIPIQVSECRFNNCLLSIRPCTISLTRTGKLKQSVYGAFLHTDSSACQLIGSHKNKGKLLAFVQPIAQNLNAEIVDDDCVVCGRLSR